MTFYGGGTVQGALRLLGRANPGPSSAGEGRIYFDSGTNLFQVSQDGGPYVPLANDPSRQFRDFTDWVAADAAGETGWTSVTSGTGAGASATFADEANRPGQLLLSTGTTDAGRAGVHKGGGNGFNVFLRPSTRVVFETALKIPALADETDGFTVRVGFGSTVLGTNGRPANGVWFEYSPSATPATQNWKALMASSPTTGVQEIGVAPQADVWTKLRIEAGANWLPRFYVDGVLAYESNIGLTTNQCTPFLAIYKTAGTTSRDVVIDYALCEVQFATPR